MLPANIAETMAEISLLTEQTKQNIAKDDLVAADASLLQRQQLIEHLVAMETPISVDTKSFLENLLQDDDAQIAHLEQLKSAIKSQQSNTKRSAKSINRYLDIKQF